MRDSVCARSLSPACRQRTCSKVFQCCRGTAQKRFACAPGSKNAVVMTSSGDQFDRKPLASIHSRCAMLRTCSEKSFWSRTSPHAYTTTRPPSSSQLLEARTQCQRHGHRLRGYQPLWSARAHRVQPSAAPQTMWWRTGATQLIPTAPFRPVGPFRG